MQSIMGIKFYCPRCDRPATVKETEKIFYCGKAFRNPYFLCEECLLIFISKQLIRKIVSTYWHSNKLEKFVPFGYYYEESITYLEAVLYHRKQLGYKLARFKKHSS